MRRAIGTVLALLLCPLFGAGQNVGRSRFWQGKLEIYQFNFSFGTRTEKEGAAVYRGMDVWKYEYRLYQNPEGVAREDLTHINRNRSMEPPLDVRLMDYAQGTGLVFDKGQKQALSGPLVPVRGTPTTPRKILGFVCEGKQYEWTTFQNATLKVESWTAQNSGFKVPLLEVEYFTDESGSLLALTIKAVSELEPVTDVPASLFQAPEGLRIVHVPSVR